MTSSIKELVKHLAPFLYVEILVYIIYNVIIKCGDTMKFKLLESVLTEHIVTVHDDLNPVLWENEKLKPQVKEKILALVDEFQSTLDVPLTILDINIVGSNAAYNYTDKSDVDVHIITNFEEYGYPKEFVEAAMNAFKTNFNNKYDIDYEGFNVEVYVEDVRSSPQSNGIYSVLGDKWIKEPSAPELIEIDLEPELTSYKDIINYILRDGTEEDIVNIIDQLYLDRRNSLVTDGEFGKHNIIFKQLRNDGLLDALKQRRVELASEELSI